jgi:hypothetical protein
LRKERGEAEEGGAVEKERKLRLLLLILCEQHSTWTKTPMASVWRRSEGMGRGTRRAKVGKLNIFLAVAVRLLFSLSSSSSLSIFLAHQLDV